MHKELKDYLPFWDGLTAADKAALAGAADEREFPAGTVLHRGAEDCVGLMIVTKGRLRVYTLSDEGRELTLYRLLERDICLFSASCIMNSIQFDVLVSAEEDTAVLHLPAETYKAVMQRSAAAANYTSELMAARFSEVMWLMDQVMNKRLDERLAAFLLEEAELRGAKSLAITHEQIANHMGTQREVITRMLRHFQQEGLVVLSRGRVELANEAGLQALSAEARR